MHPIEVRVSRSIIRWLHSCEGCSMVAQQQHPVMIVDDDPDLLQLMSTTLRNNGFQVVARTSPPNWLELGQADPAMIFMDVDLGRANGANLCKSIKENLPQWKLP